MEEISKGLFVHRNKSGAQSKLSYLLQSSHGNRIIGNFKGTFPTAGHFEFLESSGKISQVLVTHRDEVRGEGLSRLHARLGVPLTVHEGDVSEIAKRTTVPVHPLKGRRIDIAPDFTAFHAPGHSAGFCYYLWRGPAGRFLFCGDMPGLRGTEPFFKGRKHGAPEIFALSLQELAREGIDYLLPCIAENNAPLPCPFQGDLEKLFWDRLLPGAAVTRVDSAFGKSLQPNAGKAS